MGHDASGSHAFSSAFSVNMSPIPAFLSFSFTHAARTADLSPM
jgi:hypothetical protein